MYETEHIIGNQRRTAHWILWSAVAFLLVAFVWAEHATLDEVTSGEGKVIPSSKTQVIQNLEGGIISELLVKEGDIVDQSQILMHIDDTRFASSFREGKINSQALEAKVARLSAEANGVSFKIDSELETANPDIVENEKELYEARQRELDAKLSILKNQVEQREHELQELIARKMQFERSYELVNKELQLTEPLLPEGVVSEVEVLRLQRQTNDLAGELKSAELAIPRARAAIEEAQHKVDEEQISFQTQARNELSDAKAIFAALGESNAALEDRYNRTAVRSPVRGTVKQMHIATVGGVVQPGMDLMEIVPLNDTLLIEAKIRPQDIGFLHPGQAAMVKVTAYDFSIYGGLPATVEHISADTITNDRDESFYKIYVRTDKNFLGTDNEPLIIIPGMLTTVDILTGEKTVMDYLLKPILKAKYTALRER